jgi:hypothetical protein
MQTSPTDPYPQHIDHTLSERSAEIEPFLQTAGVTELFETWS